ncbi:MAG: phosphate ABC transporter permease subunit PstC [Planctomycetes bacterium]|nr:phosphate ABC transporter permease subunit PstC [Planctomycetota bacterium]
MQLTKQLSLARIKESAIKGVLMGCASLSLVTTLMIVYMFVTEAVVGVGGNTAFFQEVSVLDFLTDTEWSPQFSEKHFGILPLLCGTVVIAGIGGLIGLPIGLAAAIYLSEYAHPKLRRVVKPLLEILAGIPSVVYGYFALVFVTPYVLRPIFQSLLGIDVDIFNAMSAGIVVGVMIIPTVCSLSEDALRSVPRGLREAGYALGSTKYDVSLKVVVPAAFSGIVASFLLAISRAIGETMAVCIAAGQMPRLSLNPFRSMETMTAFMVSVSLGDTPAGTIEYKSLYGVGFTLFLITLGMNILAQWVMKRFREVYE